MLFYAHNPIFFHSITLPFQPYNFPNTLQIPHLIPIKCYNSQGFMLDSLTPHVLFWDILSFSLGFNYHQFPAGYQLLICNFIQGFSQELQKRSILDTSTLSSQSHLKYIIFTLFSLLGSLIFWRHCSPMSLQASTLESTSTFPSSSSFLLQSIIISCKIFFTYFSSN